MSKLTERGAAAVSGGVMLSADPLLTGEAQPLVSCRGESDDCGDVGCCWLVLVPSGESGVLQRSLTTSVTKK